jgi:hypothetical protein
MLKAEMFLSVVLLVNLNNATLTVDNPQVAFKAPVVLGKESTPTPEGIYLVEKAYSTKLKTNMLVFKKEDGAVWSIHPNLNSRKRQIESKGYSDNYLSKGCIGVSQETFTKLWDIKQSIVLQIY